MVRGIVAWCDEFFYGMVPGIMTWCDESLLWCEELCTIAGFVLLGHRTNGHWADTPGSVTMNTQNT